MKNITKRIITVVTMSILIVSAYLLGTTQATTETIEKIPDGYTNTTTEEFYNNYIDLRTVNGYSGTANGLELYTEDGNGYYLDTENRQADTTQIYYIGSENDFDTLMTALEHRKGKIIIEVSTGTVTTDNGDGEDINGYYIGYDTTKFSKGDKVQSIFVYNPDSNYTDDTLYRVDTLIE